MATSLATRADLEAELGRALTSAEFPKADRALGYVSNLVRALAPWVDSLTTVPEGVVQAIASAAARRFAAPNPAVSQRSVGQVQESYRADVAATFAHDEMLLLNRALGLSGNLTVSIATPDPVV